VLKYALLGLLVDRPRHGYDLKAGFETLVGGTWPLNIGQVYTTLGRLERDGLVRSELVEQDPRPDRRVYSLTETGEKELRRWLVDAVEPQPHVKDEFYVKVLLHRALALEDPADLLWAQRQNYLETLATLTAVLDEPSLADATRLLVEGAVLHVEADLRWLDRCEETLLRGG